MENVVQSRVVLDSETSDVLNVFTLQLITLCVCHRTF